MRATPLRTGRAAAGSALAGLALMAALAACGGAQEVSVPAATGTPAATTAPATATVAAPVSPTAAPTPVTLATPVPAPGGWSIYSDPNGLFTLAYPPTWYERDGHFYSQDPETWSSGPDLPSGVVKVEANYYEARGSSGCGGALVVDPQTGEGVPAEGATSTALGGLPAWQIDRQPGDPLLNDPLTRIVGISAIYKSYCFSVIAYFTQQSPDVDTFLRIARAFQFKF